MLNESLYEETETTKEQVYVKCSVFSALETVKRDTCENEKCSGYIGICYQIQP
jgi:hypothetical protein